MLAAPPETPAGGAHYENLFYDLRARSVAQLRIAAGVSGGAAEGAALDRLAEATGLFLAGGALLRLSAALGGTPLGEAVRRRHAAGLVVAGLGTGAAVLAGRVVLDGARQEPQPAPGLGLVEDLFVDASPRPRDRLDRLLAGLALSEVSLALGLDPDTAAIVSPDGTLLVAGSGAVVVAEAGTARPGSTWAAGTTLPASALAAAPAGGPARAVLPPATLGLRLDVLSPGCRYDLRARRALPPPPAVQPAPGARQVSLRDPEEP